MAKYSTITALNDSDSQGRLPSTLRSMPFLPLCPLALLQRAYCLAGKVEAHGPPPQVREGTGLALLTLLFYFAHRPSPLVLLSLPDLFSISFYNSGREIEAVDVFRCMATPSPSHLLPETATWVILLDGKTGGLGLAMLRLLLSFPTKAYPSLLDLLPDLSIVNTLSRYKARIVL